MDISSFENQAAATEVQMDKIRTELLIPENNRKRNFHESKMNLKKTEMDF